MEMVQCYTYRYQENARLVMKQEFKIRLNKIKINLV